MTPQECLEIFRRHASNPNRHDDPRHNLPFPDAAGAIDVRSTIPRIAAWHRLRTFPMLLDELPSENVAGLTLDLSNVATIEAGFDRANEIADTLDATLFVTRSAELVLVAEAPDVVTQARLMW